MTDYTLHYWPIPFRGQLVRWVMAHAGASWNEVAPEDVQNLRMSAPDALPVPLMAPPVLQDHANGHWQAQLTAVLVYLGQKHGLLAQDPMGLTATIKLICDANDVLDSVTCFGGAAMWDGQSWAEQGHPRLIRWLKIFELTATQSGVSRQGGCFSGASAPDLRDIVSAALWHTMVTRLPPLRATRDTYAPVIAAHADRIAALPALAAFDSAEMQRLPDVYCGGMIEDSLRHALGMPERKRDGII